MSRKTTARNAKTGTLVREPSRAYGSIFPPRTGYITEVRETIKGGLSARSAETIRRILGVTKQEAADLLGISPSTLARRKSKNQLLTPQESDRVYRLDKVWTATLRLFDNDADMARTWLKTPLETLEGETPLNFCDTEAGAQFINDLIGRLEHGVFS